MTAGLHPAHSIRRAAGAVVAHWHADTQGLPAARFDYVFARRGVRDVYFAPEAVQPIDMRARAIRRALLHLGASRWAPKLVVRMHDGARTIDRHALWDTLPFAREQARLEELGESFPSFWRQPGPYLYQSFDLAVRLFQAPGVWRGTRTVGRAIEHAEIVSFAGVDRIMRGAVPDGRIMRGVVPDGRVTLRQKPIAESLLAAAQSSMTVVTCS